MPLLVIPLRARMALPVCMCVMLRTCCVTLAAAMTIAEYIYNYSLASWRASFTGVGEAEGKGFLINSLQSVAV